MAMAAIPVAAQAAEAADRTAQSLFSSFVKFSENPLWKRETVRTRTWTEVDKNGKAHVLTETRTTSYALTNGMVLGMVLFGLGWEAAQWFATETGTPMLDLLNPVNWIELNLETGSPIYMAAVALGFAPASPIGANAVKSVKVPPSFGVAFNAMMRDLTVGGPGWLASRLKDLMAGLTPGTP